MNCGEFRSHEVPEQYVAGRLSEVERESYEAHFFGCQECSAELEFLLETREAVQMEESRIRQTSPARMRWWMPLRIPAVLIATLVVVFAAWFLVKHRIGAAPERIAAGPVRPDAASLMAELAQLSPPEFQPVKVRGPGSAELDAGAAAYRKREYLVAIPLFRRAAIQGDDRGTARFFLGVCFLLAGDITSAIDELNRATQEDSPYLDRAHVVLAKAYMRSGKLDEARIELRAAADLKGPAEMDARELLSKLQVLSAPTQ